MYWRGSSKTLKHLRGCWKLLEIICSPILLIFERLLKFLCSPILLCLCPIVNLFTTFLNFNGGHFRADIPELFFWNSKKYSVHAFFWYLRGSWKYFVHQFLSVFVPLWTCDKRSLAAFCGFTACSWKYHFYEESSYPTVGNMVIYWTIRDQIIVWIQPGRVQLLDYYNAMLFEFAAEEIWVLWGTIQSKCCSWVIQILQIESSIWIKVYILIWCFGTLIKWPNYCKLDLNYSYQIKK